ncbi:MAG: DHA2 family efflux MFS transporter permease subunit [Steroidobacteraceae bacterium]
MTPASATAASPIIDEATQARNRRAISVLLVATFVVILNETIMSVAIPRLMISFRIAADTAQWVSTAFMLAMAVLIPITGFLLQRCSTRTVFIMAMGLFSSGTLIAALAPGFTILVAGRIVQACGTAIMMPLLMTTIMTVVPEASRGRTMGNISIVIAVAPAIGPSISGLILRLLEWRWMFVFVLPIAVASLVIGAVRIPNVTVPRRIPIDVTSVVLTIPAFGGLVYALSNFGAASNNQSIQWISLGVGVVALLCFVLRQLSLQRTERALLDLRTFASRDFTIAICAMAICMMTLFGALILLPIYMQNVIHLDTLSTGLLLAPGALLMGLLAPWVGRLYDRNGPTALLATGAVIVSAALWGMSRLGAGSPAWTVLMAHVPLCVGLALLFTPLFTAGLSAIKPGLYSHGSAIIGTVQQFAGAAGTALFVSVMTSRAVPLLARGAAAASATGSGIQAAFMFGAIISMLAIPAVFFVRRPRTAAQSRTFNVAT